MKFKRKTGVQGSEVEYLADATETEAAMVNRELQILSKQI